MIRHTIPLASLLVLALAAPPRPAAAQDAAAGQRVFNQCRSCHTVDAGGRSGRGSRRRPVGLLAPGVARDPSRPDDGASF